MLYNTNDNSPRRRRVDDGTGAGRDEEKDARGVSQLTRTALDRLTWGYLEAEYGANARNMQGCQRLIEVVMHWLIGGHGLMEGQRSRVLQP